MEYERKNEMKQDLRRALGGGGNRKNRTSSGIDQPNAGKNNRHAELVSASQSEQIAQLVRDDSANFIAILPKIEGEI